MMKKLLIVLLSVSLVMALAVTGVYAFSDYPSSGVEISEVVANTYFFRVSQLDFAAMSTSDHIDLFNGLTLHKNGSGYAYIMFNGGYSSTYSFSTSYYYFYFMTNGNLQIATVSQDISFGSVPASNVNHFNISVNSNALTNNDLLITLGDGYHSGDDTVGETVGFSIPAGYALVIDGPCEISERSYYINNSWNFYKNGNLRINGAFEKSLSNTYIRDGYSPDVALTFDQLIQWDAMNVNILGSASDYESYSSEAVSIGSDSCYVIGYPTLFGTGDENSRLLYTNAVDMVCGLYMTYTTRPSFRFVAIESLSGYRNDGTFYTYSAFRPEIADVEGSPSEGSGGVVITPESSLPSGGGNTGQPPVDEDGSLLGTISRFVNDIKRLLSSAFEAINTLVNDGSSFMQSIGAMFSWLPAPLLSVITSAFVILVVVGVLKVLWR